MAMNTRSVSNGLVAKHAFLFRGVFLAALVASCLCASNVFALTLPPGFTRDEFVGGLVRPTAMAFAPDGRIFVTERAGHVRVVENGALVADPFVSVVVNTEIERGLTGLAIDPDFYINGYIYIYYTDGATLSNRISRFRANPNNPNKAIAGSETVILEVGVSPFSAHNGGAMAFGKDGMLYVGIGDFYEPTNAQDLSLLYGKLLRINARGFPNIIPNDNPFVGQQNARAEIWSYGLRNPFTLGIDPQSGVININDVGLDLFEEINRGVAGANYGWPSCEGPCNQQGFTDPAHAYDHSDNSCSIVGGAFYRADAYPGCYKGAYFFSDLCSGWIHMLRNGNNVEVFATELGFNAIDIDVGPDGRIYYLSFFGGHIRVINYQDTNFPGDANGDNCVDLIDYSILRDNFTNDYLSGTCESYQQYGDFNNDGRVYLDDFIILKANFGRCASTAAGADKPRRRRVPMARASLSPRVKYLAKKSAK